MQPDFEAALQTVMEFELTLRRITRLELMRRYGRKWLVEVPGLYETIEPRIAMDTRAGIYDSSCSELSYLTLRELSDFIFKQSWNTIFRAVFDGKLGYLSDIQKKINPLRNKIAHFRSVKRMDLFNARGIAEMRDGLRMHYTVGDLTAFHIQSDPCYSDSWIDGSITGEAIRALAEVGHENLWIVAAEGDYLRQFGFSLGLGLFHGHVFFEFFNERGFPIEELDLYLVRNKESISFISLHANKLRVLFSLANDPRDTAKLARGVQKILAAAGNDLIPEEPNAYGVTEYFVGPNTPPMFSFAL
jgi:hypothetical protein